MSAPSSHREPWIHLSRKQALSPVWSILIRVLGLVLGLAACSALAFLLIEPLRDDPSRIGEFYKCFWDGSFSMESYIWEFIMNSAVLLCIALALTPVFRMRYWNTGAEGQVLMGVLAAIAVNFYLGGRYDASIKLPWDQVTLLMLAASLIAGTVWALIPALFKVKWNTNETLFTLMMNYVAMHAVDYCRAVWVPNGSMVLSKLTDRERLRSGILYKLHGIFPSLGKYNDHLLIALIVLFVTALMYVYLRYTKHGYEINVVGESHNTARYAGINVKKAILRTVALSGLICGLAGWLLGAGIDRTVSPESAKGWGFTAILVAWLAKFNPVMMIVTSALITFLSAGKDQITQVFNVKGALPDVFIGVVLLFVIGSEFFVNYSVHFKKPGKGAHLHV